MGSFHSLPSSFFEAILEICEQEAWSLKSAGNSSGLYGPIRVTELL